MFHLTTSVLLVKDIYICYVFSPKIIGFGVFQENYQSWNSNISLASSTRPESRSGNIKKLEFIFLNLIATFQRYCFSGARYIWLRNNFPKIDLSVFQNIVISKKGYESK